MAEYLSNRAGDSVQSVVFYHKDDLEIHHVRSDVEEIYTEERLEDIVDILRDQLRPNRAEQAFDMGQFQCSLLGFEEGIVLHFPQGGSKGTVITLDADVTRQFSDFVGECAERIYGN